MKILHVVGGMNRGGVETWLMHVLRQIDRTQFHLDFVVHTTEPRAYDDEIRALGARIFPCPYTDSPLRYAREFKNILRSYGPYDVVHSHVHHYSGYVLRLAYQAGVPMRIAHSHSDTSRLQSQAGFCRQQYLSLMEAWVRRYAVVGISASRKAAEALFGAAWEQDSRWRLLYCGIDLTPFREPAFSAVVRTQLNIPLDAFVIGHVGSFLLVKNHVFLIEIAAEIMQRESKTYLLLVGDGALRADIEQKVRELGLSEQVIFAGLRADVPRVMRAMDVFVMPSLYEGLPLVGIEAQACGLPFILSDTVSEDLDYIKPLMHRVSLSQPASAWAEIILTAKQSPSGVTPEAAVSLIENSPFNITDSLEMLKNVYLGIHQK